MTNFNKKGMTLVELLAVISIISILFILLIPQISNAFEKARLTGLKNDFNSYRIALNSHYLSNNEENHTEDSINDFLDKELRFSSNVSKKKNPWGIPYNLSFENGDKSIVISTKKSDKDATAFKLIASLNSSGEFSTSLIGFNSNTTIEPEPVDPPDPVEILTDEQKADIEKTRCTTRNIQETDASYFTTNDIEGGVEILSYSSSGPKDVVIPCKINGKNVININRVNGGAFQNRGLTSVVLPDSLKSISGSWAFYGNYLTKVTIPDSITSMASRNFSNNRLTYVRIPSSLTSIPSRTFSNNLLETVYIPSSITRIVEYSFDGNNLSSVHIPSKVTLIGQYAFEGNNLTNVRIPSSVTSVDLEAFYNNPLLKNIINKSAIDNASLLTRFNSSPTITN